MKTLEINEANALKAYNTGSAKEKTFLEMLFGKEVFTPKKITDRIKNLEDAIAEIGGISSNVQTLLNYNGIDQFMIGAQTQMKLAIITRALNEDWFPDWEDKNQKKWYPWFNLSSGFAFSASGYYGSRTTAGVGSQLCFRSQELSDYAGQQFELLYKDLLTLKY